MAISKDQPLRPYVQALGDAIDNGDIISAGAVEAFGTVAQMQAATYLTDGMVCHTNGFHVEGDGGAAYYMIGTTGTANGMDVLALQGGLLATNVDPNPNVLNYGYTDDLGVIVNHMLNTLNTIEVPDGAYDLLTPIYLKNTSTLHFGARAHVYFNGISAITNDTYPLLYANVIGGRFYGTNKTGTAIDLKQARQCTVDGVYITNVDKGIVLDGQTAWCASNTVINPTIYLFNTGIHLTANSGKQTNNTVIIGGHLLDSGSGSTATALLLDASGDTNKCFGLAVEDCAIGYDSQSISSNVPLLLVGCRAENIVTYVYRCNSSSRRNIIIGCSFTDQSNGMSIGARWNQDLDLRNLDNSFLNSDGKGLYFYDSGHSLRRFLFYTAEENKMSLIPYGQSQKVAIGGTDSSQVRKEYLVAGGANGLVFPQGKLKLKSSTSGSSKYFEVTVDDSGAITATEVTLS